MCTHNFHLVNNFTSANMSSEYLCTLSAKLEHLGKSCEIFRSHWDIFRDSNHDKMKISCIATQEKLAGACITIYKCKLVTATILIDVA